MKYVTGMRCLRCGTLYAPNELDYVCDCRPNVGSDLAVLDVEFDYAAITREVDPQGMHKKPEAGIGRFGPLLPVNSVENLPPLPVGSTPLVPAPRLGESLGLKHLHIKDDGRNPSASLKDRASAIAAAKAREGGKRIVATASTGNAAAALAVQCAAAGQPNVIFVPRSAPQAKIAQLLVFGSTVLAVQGNYDDAFDLCTEVCAAYAWYNRNTGYNPFMSEGKKTVAYEIAEQLAQQAPGADAHRSGFVAPDVVFVAVGDGCILGGVYKGFADLQSLGWIERMPRLIGVQSQQSAALYQAWRAGAEVPAPVQATTRADSISVNAPRDAIKALRAVRASRGAFVAITDEAILAAIAPLARLGAVFAEPAGAAAYAGLAQAVQDGLVEPDETVVVINTGSGLKDVPAAMQVAGAPLVIEPTLEAVGQALPRSVVEQH
jgi:threonine synthase